LVAVQYAVSAALTVASLGVPVVAAKKAAEAALTATTGRISGTPSAARAATIYTVTASNGSGTSSATFTITATAVVYNIGDTGPGGGKIFYVASTPFTCGPTLNLQCTYLESAPITWNGGSSDPVDYWIGGTDSPTDYDSIPGAQGVAIGTGYMNSLAIQNKNSGLGAATRCLLYRGGGLSDWFLMSRFEADELYKQRATDGYVVSNTWTSSEKSASTANAYYLTDLTSDGKYAGKTLYQHVHYNDGYQMAIRPIRAF
jgi:hypothetical protein